MTFILAHDLGTSRHKAMLTTLRGDIVATAADHLEVASPEPGWAEQSPLAWWDAVCRTTQAVLHSARVRARQVVALSFTGQVQATLPVDRQGNPLCAALIWLDGRAVAQAKQATGGWPRLQGYGAWRLGRWLHATNGVPTLTGRDTVAKILWLRQHRPDIWPRVYKILDAKDYLLWRCTNRFVTSYDNGHITWLMNYRKMCWSTPLLRMLGLHDALLPMLVDSLSTPGRLSQDAAASLGLAEGTPVIAGANDLASMAVGCGAVAHGEVSIGLGTSAWVVAHVRKHCLSVADYTASITSAFTGRPMLVAHQELGGGCVEWLLQLLRSARLASVQGQVQGPDYPWLQSAVRHTPPGAEGLLFTPWLAGEYAPIQDPYARGSFFGLSLQHRAAHLGRAVMEGVACNVRWALQSVETLLGHQASRLRLGGGGALSDAWCQIIADVCQRPVLRPRMPDFATARGAALLVGLHLKVFTEVDALADIDTAPTHFTPNPHLASLYAEQFARLRLFYKRTRGLQRMGGQAPASSFDRTQETPFVAPACAAHHRS